MKLNRKGFTLVELLVTIAIIAIVVSIVVVGIMSILNNSEDEGNKLSIKGIKEAARVYSSEASDDSWKKADDFDAFCVTIEELMNKGTLDKNAIISEEGITKDTYVIVKRNNITLAVTSEEIVRYGDANYQICTNYVPGEDEIFTARFYRNNALSVGGSSEDYVEKSCISDNEGKCDITTPVIEAPSGYTKAGYNTNSEGKTSEISDNVPVTIHGNKNYYAIVNKEVVVTFDANGSDISSTSLKCTMWNHDDGCNISSPNIIREGYSVLGWHTSKAGTSGFWLPGTDKKVSENALYYAITKVNTFTVTYLPNGGTGGPTAETYDYGQTVSISDEQPTRSGYEFSGWNTNANGTGTSYSSGYLYNGNIDLTLYAQWKKITSEHVHTWNAIGSTLRSLFQSKFTCKYYHTLGYNIYCSECGMSATYYRTYVDTTSQIGKYACPCSFSKVYYVYYDDYVLTTDDDVKNFGGIYVDPEQKLALTTAPSTTCEEHCTDGSCTYNLLDRIGVTSIYSAPYNISNITINNTNQSNTPFTVNSNKDTVSVTVSRIKKTAWNNYKGFEIKFYYKHPEGTISLWTYKWSDDSGSNGFMSKVITLVTENTSIYLERANYVEIVPYT